MKVNTTVNKVNIYDHKVMERWSGEQPSLLAISSGWKSDSLASASHSFLVSKMVFMQFQAPCQCVCVVHSAANLAAGRLKA